VRFFGYAVLSRSGRRSPEWHASAGRGERWAADSGWHSIVLRDAYRLMLRRARRHCMSSLPIVSRRERMMALADERKADESTGRGCSPGADDKCRNANDSRALPGSDNFLPGVAFRARAVAEAITGTRFLPDCDWKRSLNWQPLFVHFAPVRLACIICHPRTRHSRGVRFRCYLVFFLRRHPTRIDACMTTNTFRYQNAQSLRRDCAEALS
jgi:hypothetical protein